MGVEELSLPRFIRQEISKTLVSAGFQKPADIFIWKPTSHVVEQEDYILEGDELVPKGLSKFKFEVFPKDGEFLMRCYPDICGSYLERGGVPGLCNRLSQWAEHVLRDFKAIDPWSENEEDSNQRRFQEAFRGIDESAKKDPKGKFVDEELLELRKRITELEGIMYSYMKQVPPERTEELELIVKETIDALLIYSDKLEKSDFKAVLLARLSIFKDALSVAASGLAISKFFLN